VSNDKEFDDRLNKTLDEIEKIVLFVYMTKIDDRVIKMYVTNLDYQDNGFVIEFFSDDDLSSQDEETAKTHLANEMLNRVNDLKNAS
jgi:hypothetical protein